MMEMMMLEREEEQEYEVLVRLVKVFVDEDNNTFLLGESLNEITRAEEELENQSDELYVPHDEYEMGILYPISESYIDEVINKYNKQHKDMELRKKYYSATTKEPLDYGQVFDHYKASGLEDKEAMIMSAVATTDNEISIDDLEKIR